MTQQGGIRATWCGDRIRVLPVRGELDLATADRLAARGCTALAGEVRLLLLDLARLRFCDARGASALVRIANHADTMGCRYGLIAPRPPVAKLLRITCLDQRMPVFTSIDNALAHLRPWPAPAPGERTSSIRPSQSRQSARSRMSPVGRAQNPQANTVTGATRPGRPAGGHALASPGHARDPWLHIDPDAALVPPLPGQPGHGPTAFLRRQPARIFDGRAEGGYTDVFELICPSCGDHPCLDYSQVPARLQQIRGPHPIDAGLAAYEKHLGPATAERDRRAGCLP